MTTPNSYVSSGSIVSGQLAPGYWMVLPGGSAVSATLQPFSQLYVSSGGYVSSIIAGENTQLSVYSGGSAYLLTLNQSALEYLYTSQYYTNIENGGFLYVEGNSLAQLATVYAGGSLYVAAGGSANETELDGGVLTVNAGAKATYTELSGGLVQALGAVSGTTLRGGTEQVFSGGATTGSLVSSGALEEALSSGVASATTISFGGSALAELGGVLSGALVSSGGIAVESAGGSSVSATILTGGEDLIAGGGFDSSAVISQGAELLVSGGTADLDTVLSGASLIVSGNGLYESGNAFGSVFVESGELYAAGLGNGARAEVGAGGLIYDATIYAGGYAHIDDGGIINGVLLAGGSADIANARDAGVVIGQGGQFVVSNGGFAQADTVSGGVEEVALGGIATATYMFSGTLQVDEGGALYGAVLVGGTANVLSGGSAADGGISGGTETIAAGGLATNATVLGSGALVVAGSARGIAVQSGGSLRATSGGIAGGATVSSGGGAVVSAGGLLAGAMLASGATLQDAGLASGVVIQAGGSETVQSGGVDSGGTVGSGGVLTVSGSAVATVVQPGGTLDVASGGAASGATVASGAVLSIGSGGSAAGGTVTSGGSATVASAGSDSGTTVASGGHLLVFGSAAGAVASGGTISVGSGGAAAGEQVLAGGQAMVAFAATESGGTIGSGGAEQVQGTASATVITADGTLTVLSAGHAFAPVIDGGDLIVLSGGGVTNPVIGNNGTLELTSGADVTGSIAFTSRFGDLVIDGTVMPTVTLDGFGQAAIAPNATIDFAGVSFNLAAAATVGSNAVLTLDANGHSYALQLDPSRSYAGVNFTLFNDGSGGIDMVDPPCFATGTLLATPSGDVRVEAIGPGDTVLAMDPGGAWRPARVCWVGRMCVEMARHVRPSRVAPVRIRAHAFGPGLPARDLLLSPEHAVFMDGVLFQAQALCNGATILRELPPVITYHHVELDRHAVLLAEGLPAESYLDTGNRDQFEGTGASRAPGDAAGVWATRACADLVLHGPRLAAARRDLRARAERLGYALGAEAALTVLADDAPVAPDAGGDYALPAGTRRVRLASRAFVPAWLDLADDARQLGVAVQAVRLDDAPLPDDAFHAGWHAPEADWRWTDGDAVLRLPTTAAPAWLSLRLAPCGARYWRAPG